MTNSFATYLNKAMISVMNQTVGAKGVPRTVQAEHVAFTLIGISMKTTWIEIAGPQHWFQPWRTHVGVILLYSSS